MIYSLGSLALYESVHSLFPDISYYFGLKYDVATQRKHRTKSEAHYFNCICVAIHSVN
jgi:hypothetical protein